MAELSRWYVVHTYSGYENKVATVIQKVVENRKMQDLILDIKVPMETVEEIKEDGTKKEIERKVFPGYVMVKVAVFENEDTGELKMSDDTWYVIRNTRGVTGFVGPDGKPIPLTDDEVYSMGIERKVIEVEYEVGDSVTITDGPFEGITGVVRDLDIQNNSVSVEISMAQRDVPIALELDQVKKA
ncbi:MAG: transcription termination/antitermination protein NusG [Clostridiales bacterium]|nr:transcription termination/antitermination protein NusG [Clostridiales bacterium]